MSFDYEASSPRARTHQVRFLTTSFISDYAWRRRGMLTGGVGCWASEQSRRSETISFATSQLSPSSVCVDPPTNRNYTSAQVCVLLETLPAALIHVAWLGCISRASCQKGVSAELLICRRLNSNAYLIWQLCIITVRTPKCNCLYLCVEQHQHYTVLAWHTSHYFMFLDQYLRLCKYVDTPFWHDAHDMIYLTASKCGALVLCCNYGNDCVSAIIRPLIRILFVKRLLKCILETRKLTFGQKKIPIRNAFLNNQCHPFWLYLVEAWNYRKGF
jgi:hypothetical protein